MIRSTFLPFELRLLFAHSFHVLSRHVTPELSHIKAMLRTPVLRG